jgi:hypothetical protein
MKCSNVYRMLLVLIFFTTCKKNSSPPPSLPQSNFHVDDQPPVDNSTPNVSITWNTTATKMSHNVYYAEYPRVHKVGGDTMLFTYHYGDMNNYWDNIAIRRSTDGGNTWSVHETLMADNNPDYYGFSNPDIARLNNGWVILTYTGRGKPDDNAHSNIQVRISKDRGWTFEAPIIAATGRSWEPAIIQLPDGEIQLFYSSEARWWSGPGSTAAQQEILMVKSDDNCITWSQPKEVAYTPGMRDGMAVPLVLKDNKGIVFPIESVNNSKSPWITWSSLSAKFNYRTPGNTLNARRWLATSLNVWGGAPYIIQLPSGETILSVQDAGGRTIGSDWKKNTMLVMSGNTIAKNFTNVSYPWPNLPGTEGAYYSAMMLKNDSTLVMVSSRNFSDGHSEVYWKEGRITR